MKVNQRVAFFDIHDYEKPYFDAAAATSNPRIELQYFNSSLNVNTANLAQSFQIICSFVNDKLDAETLRKLAAGGLKLLALRSAGYNHVDIQEAHKLGIAVVRVPKYSPYAVAEFAVGMMLSLNRKTHHSYLRMKELNFSLNGLVGFDFHGKTAGIVGTGKIGQVTAKILNGFGCKILLNDLVENADFLSQYENFSYVSLEELLRKSDIISLHVPLTPKTKHMINENTLSFMKPSAMLINTGRGGLIDTKALVAALKKQKIGFAGLDVYEEEEDYFFKDLSEVGISDDCLARLLTFPNVLVTSHQAFLTREALQNIATTTIENISDFISGKELKNKISPNN